MYGDPIEELRCNRFSDLPRHCGQDLQPGIDETEEWRDWSRVETTPDQLRIEEYLLRSGVSGKRILHIGIGNSSLALRFKNRAAEIFGTSISPEEVRHAESLGIANYAAILHNKYRGEDIPGQEAFDFIVDNNPSTFCCCFRHLVTMMEFYARNLTEGGQFVTDSVGLGWVVSTPGANPRWKFSFDDLAAVAAPVGLKAFRIDENIFVLSRCAPGRPGLIRRSLSRGRRMLCRLRPLAGQQ